MTNRCKLLRHKLRNERLVQITGFTVENLHIFGLRCPAGRAYRCNRLQRVLTSRGNETGSSIGIQSHHRMRPNDKGMRIMRTILLAGIAALGVSTGTAFAAANPGGSAAQTTNGRASPPSQNDSPQQATTVPSPTAAHRRIIISKFYR